MTTRSQGILDIINPCSYFSKGEDLSEPKYANYVYEADKYKKSLDTLIPGFAELKGMYLGDLIKRFQRFFYEINESFMKKAPKEEVEVPIPNDLKELKETIQGAIYTATGAEKSNEYIQKAFGPASDLKPWTLSL